MRTDRNSPWALSFFSHLMHSHRKASACSAGAVQAAKEFTSYIGKTAAAKAKPDLTAPPAAPLFGKIFDTKALAALPAPTAKDLSWASEWLGAGANSYMALLNFGTNPQAPDYQQAVEDNVQRYEDEISNAMNFMIRLMPRVAIAARGFMQSLSEAERNQPTRQQGVKNIRDGYMQTVSGATSFVGRWTESAECKTGRPRLARHRGRMARAGVGRRTHAARRCYQSGASGSERPGSRKKVWPPSRRLWRLPNNAQSHCAVQPPSTASAWPRS